MGKIRAKGEKKMRSQVSTDRRRRVMMYFCKFVNDGIVKESFYREGDSVKEVREGLELFDFGKGKWKVGPADEEENV